MKLDCYHKQEGFENKEESTIGYLTKSGAVFSVGL